MSYYRVFSRVITGCLLALLCPVLQASDAADWAWPTPAPMPQDASGTDTWLQPTASGDPVSALFGCVRNDGNRFHEGVDIAPVLPRSRGRSTDPVYAVHDGVVRHLNPISGHSSYGRYLVIEHDDLEPAMYSLYAHLASFADGIAPGVAVAAGQELGIMGNTAGGYRIPHSRAHLHLEFGLRLTSDFDAWYDQQSFGSANHHGNFNGMNLVGWDPVAYLRGWEQGTLRQPIDFIQQLAPGCVLHVASTARPDLLQRYPRLELPGCPADERAGWELIVSAYGVPLAMRALRQQELRGVLHSGDVSVVSVDVEQIQQYACRAPVREVRGSWQLSDNGHQLVQLLFAR